MEVTKGSDQLKMVVMGKEEKDDKRDGGGCSKEERKW